MPLNICGVFQNVLFMLLLFLTSFLGSLFILFPLLPLLFINRPLWRRTVDKIIGLWLCLPVALMGILLGIRFRVSGDRLASNEKAVIIMNHRTRLDWLFLWSALYKMDGWLLTTEKIILKSPLRKVLGAGWAMECDNFIFLERSWDKDVVVLTDSARYLSATGNAYQILIFPEGTDLCPNSRGRSETYARLNNLPHYKSVLHPRTTGLSHLVHELRQDNAIDYIYDVTIAFPDEIVQTEMDFATSGRHPRQVDFHFRRYSLNEILSGVGQDLTEADCKQRMNRWCEALWAKKEVALNTYYDNVNNNNVKENARLALGDLLEQQGGDDRSRLPDDSKGVKYEMNAACKWVLFFAFVYWMTSITFWMYALWAFWWTKYFASLGIAIFKLIEYQYRGVDRLEIAFWKMMRS